jgi:hypothetical protein
MRDRISLKRLLDALAGLDDRGGGTLDQVAWELDVEPERIRAAWEEALDDGLAHSVDEEQVAGGQRVRLTPGGWTTLAVARESR